MVRCVSNLGSMQLLKQKQKFNLPIIIIHQLIQIKALNNIFTTNVFIIYNKSQISFWIKIKFGNLYIQREEKKIRSTM